MWQPPHEEIKRTLAWFFFGAAAAALLGWALLEVVPSAIQTTARDIREIRQQALSEAYIAEYADAYSAAVTERVVYDAHSSSSGLMRTSIQPGLRASQRLAGGMERCARAMLAASLEAGVASGSSELAALEAAPRRNPLR